MPNILWAYRTTPRKTSFFMTNEAKAVIPIEISLSSIRVVDFSRSDNDTRMVRNLDSLDRRRDMVSVWLARDLVKPKEFVARDLVLWKVVRNMKD